MNTFDIQRILDHDVEIFELNTDQVFRVILTFMNKCKAYSLQQGDIPIESAQEHHKSYNYPEQQLNLISIKYDDYLTSLCKLLTNPRVQKYALRKAWASWQRLHGEVYLEDLIIYCAIHTISPEAICFMRRHSHNLTKTSKFSDNKDTYKEIEQDWKDSNASIPNNHILWILIKHLFSIFNNNTRTEPQGIGRAFYWNRIANGRLGNHEVKDQIVAKDIQKFKSTNNCKNIAQNFINNLAYSETFERFQTYQLSDDTYIKGDEVLTLASELFKKTLDSHGTKSHSKHVVGFIPLWRLQHRNRHYTNYLQWLWPEIEKAIPISLEFSKEIEYYWGSKKYTNALSVADHAELRKRICLWAKKHLKPDDYCHLLDGASINVLMSLIFGPPHDGHFDYSGKEQWYWISDVLLSSLATEPAIMTPQIVCTFSETGTEIRIPEDTTDAFHKRTTFTKWTINKTLVCDFYPDTEKRQKLFRLLLEPSKAENQWDSNIQDKVNQVRQQLRKWQKEESL